MVDVDGCRRLSYMRCGGMRRSLPPGGSSLLDDIDAIVQATAGTRTLPAVAVQDILIAVLAHLRADDGHGKLHRIKADRQSSEIQALEAPLTDLLIRRLHVVDADMPTGEALYTASVEARMIVALALRSVGG